jgi:hypothetical protein
VPIDLKTKQSYTKETTTNGRRRRQAKMNKNTKERESESVMSNYRKKREADLDDARGFGRSSKVRLPCHRPTFSRAISSSLFAL